MDDIKLLREMMKSYTAADEDFITDMHKRLPQPPTCKYYEGSERVSLPKEFKQVVKRSNFIELLETRESRRKLTSTPLSLEELSYLLWATQGVKKVLPDQTASFRTVPSAGARHPYETYLYINNVEGLACGLYHYLPMEHELERLSSLDQAPDFSDKLTEGFLGQTFCTQAPVMFLWTVVPYRFEWKYAWKGHRCGLMDAGYIGQNLYLAAESINCGTCMVGAFDQAMIDESLGLDTNPTESHDNEFAVCAAGVGHVE